MSDFKLIEKLLYRSEQQDVEGEFLIGDETLWASRSVVAEIFGTDKTNISKHFANIVQEGELEENEVSMSSKELFKDNIEFSEKSSLNSKMGEGLKNGII